MAGLKEFESIPPHKTRVRTFKYGNGTRTVKIVDTHGELDPTDVFPNGNKIMKEVTESEDGKRIIVKPIDEPAKSQSNS